jgi:hypothetical protein
MARPTCNEIIEIQLKFLVNSAVAILWTLEVGLKQLGPLMHNSPPKLTTVRIHVLVPGLGEFNLENFLT